MKRLLNNPATKFLDSLIEAEDLNKIKNPVIGAVFGQLAKLLIIIDSNPKYIETVRRLLNKVKEEWKDDS